MKVLVLLAEQAPSAWERPPDAPRAHVFEQHAAFDRAARARGSLLAGEALAAASAARTLRPAGGVQTVTEGPYAETVEQLVGLYLLDVHDLDEALDLCRNLPDGYTIEARPVIDIEGYES